MKNLMIRSLWTICLSFPLLASAIASDSFFEVGSCYLFVPRHDYASKGKVVAITSQEVVFANIKTIKATKSLKGSNEAEKIADKDQIIMEYIKSKDRLTFEVPTASGDMPVSYSRSEMAAIKLDRCGK